MTRRAYLFVYLLLLGIPVGLISYKLLVWKYSLKDLLPRTRYDVSYLFHLDGHDEAVRVRTFLPVSDSHQIISEEENQSLAMHFASSFEGLNRLGTWSAGKVPDDVRIRYRFSVVGSTVRYELADDIAVPLTYPDTLHPYLQAEEAIQVDHPEVRALLGTIGADQGSVKERLRKIYDFTSGLKNRPFKGTTDALTALRLGEASCNGKSRLFVALARTAGIPARLVGGLILQPGKKRTSHQWVEAYVGGHWVPFGPTNHHFATLPANYLVLYRGDESLFRHSSDINFDYAFETSSTLAPSPTALRSARLFDIWALFTRLGLPLTLLRTLIMLPLGALVVVLFRNVVGLPTFGTFLPALIAAAAAESGIAWGMAGIILLVGTVAIVRLLVHRLNLLHSPTLGILLAAVTATMLLIAALAEHFDIPALARVTLFPLAVTAIAAERFFLSLTEQGASTALKELSGTLVVIFCCHVVMNSVALQLVVIGFPEVLLLAVAANVYLGRWVGMRVSEYLRFRHAFGVKTS